MSSDFKVEQVDHIHVYVSDQYRAAEWYRKVFGLQILREYEDWAVDGGPLTISSDDGNTSLALFAKGDFPHPNRSTIAFRVSGEGFLAFLERLSELEVRDRRGAQVTRSDIEDHDKSLSVYFCDPDGNPYELTTYDYDLVKQRLAV